MITAVSRTNQNGIGVLPGPVPNALKFPSFLKKNLGFDKTRIITIARYITNAYFTLLLNIIKIS